MGWFANSFTNKKATKPPTNATTDTKVISLAVKINGALIVRWFSASLYSEMVFFETKMLPQGYMSIRRAYLL